MAYVALETLLAGDCAWEAVGRLGRRPTTLVQALARRRVGGTVRHRLVRAARLDPATLPYRAEVLERLAAARAAGWSLVLVTERDPAIARRIAAHLRLFDRVLLVPARRDDGATRRTALVHDAGGRRIAWLGAPADLAQLASPRREAAETEAPAAPPRRWRALVRALRPHQWTKNALLFAPIALAHQLHDLERLLSVALATVAFCGVASGTYVLNDLLDLDADRRHPRKRLRPFASGALSIRTGVVTAGVLLAASGALAAALLAASAAALLGLYAVATLAYSLRLKQQLFIDVLLLAGLYTLRVMAGGAAAGVPVSPWLLAFSTFFFLSLAFLKRYVELLQAQQARDPGLAGRAYRIEDLGLVETMGVAAGYLSVLVLCLYVSNAEIHVLYRAPGLLWAICPVMLYWVTRIWFLARRGVVSEDPVLFAARDRASLVCVALLAAVVALAALAP